MSYDEVIEIIGRYPDEAYMHPDTHWGAWARWDVVDGCSVIVEDCETTIQLEGVDAETLRRVLEVIADDPV